ncbi:type II secretion system minor pseudopilin GspJ [Thalassotalea fusca]
METSSVSAKGFTLIEVLLAIAIFAMISLASFSLFDGVIASDGASKEKMKRLNEIQRAWMVIERDLIQATQRSIRVDGEAPSTAYFHGGDDMEIIGESAIAFVRNGWTNPGLLIPRSELQSVAYRLEEGNLERLHYNFVDPVVGEEPKIRKLIENVESVSYQYFYRDKWQEKVESGVIPKAIEVTITTEDLGEIHRKFLMVGALDEK